ncbi:MAG: hypothetical protein AAGC65_17785 [Mucilaginibacter sp.]
MKRTILLALLIVSTGVLSTSSKSTQDIIPTVTFGKTSAAFKRDLGSAD